MTKKDLSLTLKSALQYDKLLNLDKLNFANPDDLIDQVVDIMSFMKKNEISKPLEGSIRVDQFFASVFQKFEEIYLQKYYELSNSNSEETSKKKLLAKLFQFEQEKGSKQVPNNLVTLLELFYDDHEHLDALLLLLNSKSLDSSNIADPLTLKIFHFITPFLKLIHDSEIHFLDYWKASENLRESLVNKTFNEIENLLRNYSDLNSEEILAFCREIREAKGDLENKREKLRRISKEKTRFPQEKRYYEILGALSLIYHLWCLKEQDTKVSIAFLRIGLVTFLFLLRDWDDKENGYPYKKLQYSLGLMNLNLILKPEIPSEVLNFLLNESDESLEKEEYLKTLELNAYILQSLITFLQNQCEKPYFKLKKRPYIDPLLVRRVSEDFVWSDFFGFLKNNLERISRIKSYYLATNCLQETMFLTWTKFLESPKVFISEESFSWWNTIISPKYLENILKCFNLVTHFVTQEKHQFALLPSYLQRKIALTSNGLFISENLTSKIDFFEIYNAVEEDGLTFFLSLKESSCTEPSPALSYFFLTLDLMCDQTWRTIKVVQKVKSFLRDIFGSSKLVKTVLSIYEEKGCAFVSKEIKDSRSAEIFVRFAIFLFTNIQNSVNILSESKNIEFTRYILEDSLNIDNALLNWRTVDELSCTVIELYAKTEIVSKFDNYKIFFMALRSCVSRPSFGELRDNDIFEEAIVNLKTKGNNLELFMILLEEFLHIFEEKVKNPSFDLDSALKEFEIQVGEGKVDFAPREEMRYLENGDNVLVDDDVTFESLDQIGTAMSRYILPLVLLIARSDEAGENSSSGRLERMVKKTISLQFSPAFIFANSCATNYHLNFTNEFSQLKPYFSAFLEGILTGVISLCEGFQLNKESTMNKINIERFYSIKVACSNALIKPGTLPLNILWVEAALTSLIEAQNLLISLFYGYDFSDELTVNLSPEVKILLQKASNLVLQTSKNLDKRITNCLVEESLEKESNRLDFLSTRSLDFKGERLSFACEWMRFLGLIYKREESQCKEDIMKISEETLEEMFLIGESLEKETEKGKRTWLVYYHWLLSDIQVTENAQKFIQKFLLKEGNFERFLNILLEIFNSNTKYENSFDLKLYSDSLWKIMEIIKTAEGDDFKDALLEKIVNFIQKLNSLKLIEQRSKKLHEYIPRLFKSFKTISASYFRKVNEDDNLIEQNQGKITRFMKAFVASEFFECVDIEWLLHFEKTLKILNRKFWIAEYQRTYKRNIEMILEILSPEKEPQSLKESLREEIRKIDVGENELILSHGETISNQTIKQLIQMNWIFKRQKIFFREIIDDELELSESFIEGITWAVEIILGELLTCQEDLTKYKSEMIDLDFPQIVNELLVNIGELLMDYIVAYISEELTNQNDAFRNLLSKILDLFDRYLEVQQYFIENLKWDILSEKCFEILMNCLSATLKINKGLRVEFLNRGSFYKLLTMKKLSKLSGEQFQTVAFLTSILLEDSLVLESNVDFVVKEFASIYSYNPEPNSLQDLLNSESFIPFKYSKRTLEFLKPSIVGKSINKSNFRGDHKNQGSTNISYLQKEISPAAKKTIQILFSALIENYTVEEQTKFSERKELWKKNKLGIEQDKPTLEEDVYYETNFYGEKALVKDTSALILLISSIIQTMPYLIPYMIFQKADMDEILQLFKSDENILHILENRGENWSMLDVLFRLAFYKDGGIAVYLPTALINSVFFNGLSVSEEKMIDLILNKIKEIFKEMLEGENSAGKAYKSLESILMRKSMMTCLLNLTRKFDNNPYLRLKKRQVLRLNLSLMPSFLHNHSLLAELTEKNTFILSGMTDLLKLYFEYGENLSESFSPRVSQVFEEQLFNIEKGFIHKEINKEEQMMYETWDERERWGKEGLKIIFEYASVYGSTQLSQDFIKLPIDVKKKRKKQADQDRESQLDQADIRQFNRGIDELAYFEEAREMRNYRLEYQQDREKENYEFLNTLARHGIRKRFNNRSEYLQNKPKILRPNLEKAQSLVINNDKNIFEDYLLNDENEEQKQEDKAQIEEYWAYDDEEIETDNSPDKEEENSGIKYQYFVDQNITSQGNFRFKINQALKKSRRVKEMICLEKKFGELLNTLRNSEHFEEMIQRFTQDLSEFERNVVYAGLGLKIASLLSHETQEKIKNIQDELKSIRENYWSFDERLRKIQGPNDRDEQECDSRYDELDYDFEFLIEGEMPGDQNSFEEVIQFEEEQVSSRYDKLILEISKLLFSHFSIEEDFSIREDGLGATLRLAKSLCLNPENEIKVFDTMLFLLYSPEYFERDFKSEDEQINFPKNSLRAYEVAAQNIITFLCLYKRYENRDVFFMSKENLDKFGNQLLKNLKEKTGFTKKISECSSILDMILGLLGTKSFLKNPEWIDEILERAKSLMLKKGNVTDFFKQRPNKMLSEKIILGLLDLAKEPSILRTNESPTLQKIFDIFSIFKSHISLALLLQENSISYLTPSLLFMNDTLTSLLKLFQKQQFKSTLLNDAAMKAHLKVIEWILSCFSNALYQIPSNTKHQEILVEGISDILLKQEEAKGFILTVYDFLETIQSHIDKEKITPFVLIIAYHFSIVLMIEQYEKKKQSLKDISNPEGSFPSLSKLVSVEMTRSDSRKEADIDFRLIFSNFAWRYSSAISELNDLNASFSNALAVIIPQYPWILDFETKSNLLWRTMNKRIEETGASGYNDRRVIMIDRKTLVHSAMKSFKNCDKMTLLQNLKLKFRNEQGFDAGGLRREFFTLLAKDLFDPSNGLFRVSANHQTIQPSPFSDIVPNDLKYFEFAGIILAKAITDCITLNFSFTKSLLKHILGKEIIPRDLEDIDADLSRNLEWTLENSVDEVYLTFTHEMDFLGERLNFDLEEGGSEIFVNEENKKEYVKKVCEFRMTKQIERRIQAFLKGFYSITPKDFLSYFTVAELEMLISGAPNIDLEEMKKYTIYKDYNETSNVVIWLWKILGEFGEEQLGVFYYYISGSVKVRVGGFSKNPIKIRRAGDKDRLPVAHTCSYELDLPEYESKEKLQEKLFLAIFDGTEGFHLV